MDIQELIAQTHADNNAWKIVGLIGLNEPIIIDSSLIKLPATKNTITIVKELLANGKEIFVSKSILKSEIHPNDLIIKDTNELQCAKNLAIQEINNAIQQTAFSVSTLECFDYLTSYMKMLANGIFITDENREDKYFEIIEQAQLNEKPSDLPENASFEDEQLFFKRKQKYDIAQENLKNLEKYLNAYDKLSKVNYVHNKLQKIKNDITNSNSIEELNQMLHNFYESEQPINS